MLKNISKLEFQIGSKIYQFLCDMDAPLEHAQLAISEFKKYLDNVEAAAKEAQAPKEEQQQA